MAYTSRLPPLLAAVYSYISSLFAHAHRSSLSGRKAFPRSMSFSSIRALSFVCLVCLSSLIHLVEAACGGVHEAEFNANGFPQGQYGELYTAVRCILHGYNCDANVFPPMAKGASANDKSKLIAYYGANISNWCVGMVKDFSHIFDSEVSNKARMTMAPSNPPFTSYFSCTITVSFRPTAAMEYEECNGYELHVF
jgi:hypothetical protein